MTKGRLDSIIIKDAQTYMSSGLEPISGPLFYPSLPLPMVRQAKLSRSLISLSRLPILSS
ncbi:hypothetical protein LguiA_014461 [Lonicera macranthoides]